jgi:hypothetical protein
MNQGRSPQQMKNNYKGAFFSIIGLLITILIIIITQLWTQ